MAGAAACYVGVLIGDFVVYALGYFYGERVMSLPWARKFLTRAREAQIKGYFHRHGIKILIFSRFAPGFRTAAYLTAGILRLPPLRLLGADLIAVTLSTVLLFGLGYYFAHWVETGWRQAQGYLVAAAALGISGWILYRFYKAWRRAGQPVGPPVPISDDVPIPPDDLHPPVKPLGSSSDLPQMEKDVLDKSKANTSVVEAGHRAADGSGRRSSGSMASASTIVASPAIDPGSPMAPKPRS